MRARSGGNPLYVTTLARLLASEPGAPLEEHTLARIVGSSAEVSGLVRSLLRGLDDDAAAVLAAASVLGEAFDPALVAAISPATGEVRRALAAADRRGLVSPLLRRPGSWRFTHALIRDGIYASLPEDQRTGLHQRAAAALGPLAGAGPGRRGRGAPAAGRTRSGRAAAGGPLGHGRGGGGYRRAGLRRRRPAPGHRSGCGRTMPGWPARNGPRC